MQVLRWLLFCHAPAVILHLPGINKADLIVGHVVGTAKLLRKVRDFHHIGEHFQHCPDGFLAFLQDNQPPFSSTITLG